MTDDTKIPQASVEPDAPSDATRGDDDRRSTVNPADNPAPRNPEPDEDAVRKGEDTLERVKPY